MLARVRKRLWRFQEADVGVESRRSSIAMLHPRGPSAGGIKRRPSRTNNLEKGKNGRRSWTTSSGPGGSATKLTSTMTSKYGTRGIIIRLTRVIQEDENCELFPCEEKEELDWTEGQKPTSKKLHSRKNLMRNRDEKLDEKLRYKTKILRLPLVKWRIVRKPKREQLHNKHQRL